MRKNHGRHVNDSVPEWDRSLALEHLSPGHCGKYKPVFDRRQALGRTLLQDLSIRGLRMSRVKGFDKYFAFEIAVFSSILKNGVDSTTLNVNSWLSTGNLIQRSCTPRVMAHLGVNCLSRRYLSFVKACWWKPQDRKLY